MLDNENKFVDQLIEKDQLIIYLKEELEKERSKTRFQQKVILENSQIKEKQQQSEKQAKRYKEKCENAQKKLREADMRSRQTIGEYEREVTKLQRQNKRLQSQISQLKSYQNGLQLQIDKVTKFYKSSIHQIPKRKQTLLWVDNLIKFMQVSQSSAEQKHNSLSQYLSTSISQLRTQLLKSISQVAIAQQKIHTQTDRLYELIKAIVAQNNKGQIKIQQKLEQLLKTGKKQRQSSQKQQVEQLKQQVQVWQEEYKSMETKLTKSVKQLEAQKRKLQMGYIQVKTFLDNKQNNYRQEITSLKQTITSLLQAADIRQLQFQQQLKMLSTQIQTISQRYYENIEFPINKLNEKVEKEISKVKYQLTKLSQQNMFNGALDKISDKLPFFIERLQGDKDQSNAVQMCMDKGNMLLETISKLLGQMKQKKRGNSQEKSGTKKYYEETERNSKDRASNHYQDEKGTFSNQRGYNKQRESGLRSSTKSYKDNSNVKNTGQQANSQLSSLFPQQPKNSIPFSTIIEPSYGKQSEQFIELQTLEQAVSQIELRQKQNRQLYETNLLKKHNKKLTEHVAILQKKIKSMSTSKTMDEKTLTSFFKSQRKIVDLQSEVESLKEINKDYQHLFKIQLQKLHEKFQKATKMVNITHKEDQAIIQSVNQLIQRHDIVYGIIKNRTQRLDQLQKSINIINNMLIKPAETFENLVKEVAQMSILTTQTKQVNNNLGNYSSISLSGESYRSRLSINQSVIKEYQQILTKRSQINTNGSRQISQLISTIRETFGPRDNKKRQLQTSSNQKQNFLKGAALNKQKSSNSMSNFNSKSKQLFTLIAKHKQQFSMKLQTILENISGIQTKQGKLNKLNQTKEKRIEQLISKHFTAIIDEIKVLVDKDKRVIGNITTNALKDVQGKLKQVNRENQGLKKEIDVLITVNTKKSIQRNAKPIQQENSQNFRNQNNIQESSFQNSPQKQSNTFYEDE